VRTKPGAHLTEHRLREMIEGAFQVTHRDALVNDQSFELVEDRQMGRVVLVGTVDLARADDVDRQVTAQQSTHLDRAGLGPQQLVIGRRLDEQGVRQPARRMIGADVERVEVQPFRLEFGSFGYFPAHGDENVAHVVDQRGDRMQGPFGMHVDRKRDVDAFGLQGGRQFGRVELVLPGRHCSVHRAAGLSNELAGVFALAGLQLADSTVRQGKRRFVAGMIDAHLLELGGGRCGADSCERGINQSHDLADIERIGVLVCGF